MTLWCQTVRKGGTSPHLIIFCLLHLKGISCLFFLKSDIMSSDTGKNKQETMESQIYLFSPNDVLQISIRQQFNFNSEAK